MIRGLHLRSEERDPRRARWWPAAVTPIARYSGPLRDYDWRQDQNPYGGLRPSGAGRLRARDRRSRQADRGPGRRSRREVYTVNRSTFIDKKSREQFEIRTHKRIIDITEPNARTVEALNRLVVPAGVFVKIKA